MSERPETPMMPIRNRIVSAVAPIFNVGAGQVAGPSRVRPIVRARWVCWIILRKQTTLSLPQIGRLFRTDHTTVMHGLRAIEELIEGDPQLKASVAEVALVFAGEKPGQLPRLFTPWTTAEHDEAVAMFVGGASFQIIADRVGRSMSAVRERLRAHGFKPKKLVAAAKPEPIDADAGGPLVDKLDKCEDLWAAALQGAVFTSLAIKPRDMVELPMPEAHHG